MRISGTLAAAVACALVAACGQTRPTDGRTAEAPAARQWLSEMRALDLPITAPASTPQLTRAGRGVTLSWIETSTDAASLRYAEWTGGKWSSPGTAATGRNWFLSAADVPTVTRLSSGALVANWFVATNLEKEAYDLLLSYSNDEGKTWVKPFKPPKDSSQTQHGFTSIVELPDQGVGVVWLDGREGVHAKDPESAEMTLRYTSFDRNWKQGPDVAVNMRVCDCCQTSATMTSDGVITAFRDRSDKEIRDIAVARLDAGAWTPATIVHNDNYQSFSCPVNGPAISARGKEVVVAWYTVQKDVGQAFAAFSHDAGRTWSAPTRLDGGQSLGMVDVELLEDGSAAASWVEFANNQRRFMVRRVEANGAASAPIDLPGQQSGHISGYPRMSRDGDTLLFTWAEGTGGIEDELGGPQRIKGAIARLAK